MSCAMATWGTDPGSDVRWVEMNTASRCVFAQSPTRDSFSDSSTGSSFWSNRQLKPLRGGMKSRESQRTGAPGGVPLRSVGSSKSTQVSACRAIRGSTSLKYVLMPPYRWRPYTVPSTMTCTELTSAQRESVLHATWGRGHSPTGRVRRCPSAHYSHVRCLDTGMWTTVSGGSFARRE
jgi:hypothetical protein